MGGYLYIFSIYLERKTRKRDEMSIYCSRAVEEIYKAWNRHDLDVMMGHFSDDMIRISASGARYDKKGMLEDMASFLSIFPDTYARIDRMVCQAYTVWAEFTITGTHKKELFGIPATGKKIEIPVVWILDFEDSKVKLCKEFWNHRKLMLELSE